MKFLYVIVWDSNSEDYYYYNIRLMLLVILILKTCMFFEVFKD